MSIFLLCSLFWLLAISFLWLSSDRHCGQAMWTQIRSFYGHFITLLYLLGLCEAKDTAYLYLAHSYGLLLAVGLSGIRILLIVSLGLVLSQG
jgi:hypothetical protein